jgi:predicted ArsR family transcriptional regulator
MTTIQVKKSTVKSLDEIKTHPRQTYNEVIENLTKTIKKTSAKNQYDEFLHKIQQDKMKELWDNKADEAWESA